MGCKKLLFKILIVVAIGVLFYFVAIKGAI